MQPLYNIYYAGEILEGHDAATVRARLGALFKAGDSTLDKLFSGKPQLVKRECDKATALKYKQAMEKAGAKPVIRSAESAEAAPQAAPPGAEKPMTAAERIAALAAAPDVGYASEEQAPAGNTPTPESPVAGGFTDPESGVGIAATGSDLLRPGERSEPVVREVDTSAYAAEEGYARLEAEHPAPPPAPDTSHLSLGETGEIIPHLPDERPPVSPNTDALSLSPEGTDFTDCAAPEAAPPDLDLSQLDVAPEGSDVLEEQYRRRQEGEAPPTDHLSLES